MRSPYSALKLRVGWNLWGIDIFAH
jgi:hypothetical protein